MKARQEESAEQTPKPSVLQILKMPAAWGCMLARLRPTLFPTFFTFGLLNISRLKKVSISKTSACTRGFRSRR